MYRCPECRTRRKDWSLFKRHIETSGHRVCNCGGYHYAHRPGSPYCVENPRSEYHEAVRRDCPPDVLLDISAHIGWEHGVRCKPGAPPPF